jgi:hypothetical protein
MTKDGGEGRDQGRLKVQTNRSTRPVTECDGQSAVFCSRESGRDAGPVLCAYYQGGPRDHVCAKRYRLNDRRCRIGVGFGV